LLTAPGGSTLTTNVGAASTTLTVSAARLDSSFNFAEFQQVRAGFSTSVTINNSNPNAGTVGSPVAFAGGDSSNTTTFTPTSNNANAGTTNLTAIAPAGFDTPASGNTVAVTVNAQTLMAPGPITVGNHLETTTHISGGASGLSITVTSNNP